MTGMAQDKNPAASTENSKTWVSRQSDVDRAAEAAPGPRRPDEDLEKRQDQLLDEALEETFPASDPVSPKRITK